MSSPQVHAALEAACGVQPALAVGLAKDASEVREAQRLRYRVFTTELGARLRGAHQCLDLDLYDPHCEHLIVRDHGTGEVVGTYRMLTADAARRIGGFYCDDEFDLARLGPLRGRILEAGRACVHPDYRNGHTIALLWHGLARFIERSGAQYVIGCASIPAHDGGHAAASIHARIRRDHVAPLEYRVYPWRPLPLRTLQADLPCLLPPLVKAYLRLGAWICGDPAFDPEFNTADLLVLLPMTRIEDRYVRRFMAA